MKISKLFFLTILGIFLLSGCGKSALTKDAERIADAMCRSKGITEKLTLEATKPMADSLKIVQMQTESEKIQREMMAMYQEFNKKYADKVGDKKFNKEFGKELSRALMNCQYLSEDDKKMLKEKLED
jgi:hypothetical protein